MNNQVDRVVEEAKQLSYEELKAASERILDMLDEMEWDAIVAKPHMQKRLSELGDKAWQEHLGGKTEEGGFDCREELP
jgi:hypothetical protein